METFEAVQKLFRPLGYFFSALTNLTVQRKEKSLDTLKLSGNLLHCSKTKQTAKKIIFSVWKSSWIRKTFWVAI